VTGLSVLAFLGAGYTHLSKDTHDGLCFGDVVRKALQFLLSRQDVEGCVGARTSKYLYNHALATLALSEAYGITGSMLFKDQAQKAVDFLVAAQNPGAGWRYSARPGESDGAVTGWALLALRSAELSALAFPRSTPEGGRAWFDATTDELGRTGYTARGTGKVYFPGVNEGFEHHDTMTAVATSARIFIDKRAEDPRLRTASALLLKDLPSETALKRDYMYWFWATQAMCRIDGPSGPGWMAWGPIVKGVVVKLQEKDGSWPPDDRWSADGGKVYATAINELTLQAYYCYANRVGGR
jgi:hypothetical protein